MLVVIGDLHLSDQSAGALNVPPRAFALWWERILDLAEHNRASEIELLYLGDIFDFIRSEHWFYDPPSSDTPVAPSPRAEGFPLADRPWGSADSLTGPGRITRRCRERARLILDLILRRCADQVAFLRGDLASLSPEFVAANEPLVHDLRRRLARVSLGIRRYLVSGNHDRFYLLDEEIRRKIQDALGLENRSGPGPSDHVYENPRYGVVARHGHEWDVWNFEAYREDQVVADISPDAYGLTPIGDAITGELVVRCPYEVHRRLEGKVGEAAREAVYARLQEIENVRPLHTAIQWVLWEGSRAGAGLSGDESRIVTRCVEEVVRRVLDGFMAMPLAKEWIRRHDRPGIRPDEADVLKGIERLMRALSIDRLPKLLDGAARLQGHGLRGIEDSLLRGAVRDNRFAGPRPHEGIRYCVFGHAHAFWHEPLGVFENGEEKVYFNCGTWRTQIRETRDRRAFLPVKEMSYLVFYGGDEDLIRGGSVPKGPSYETWSGLKRKTPL